MQTPLPKPNQKKQSNKINEAKELQSQKSASSEEAKALKTQIAKMSDMTLLLCSMIVCNPEKK